MRATIRVVTMLVVGVVLAGAGLAVAGILNFSLPFTNTTIDRSQPALLKSVKDISEYHAAVGNFEVVLDYEDDVNWVPGFIAGERSLFVAAGTVDAYVDFSGLADGDLQVSRDGKSVQIRLPDAELATPNLDQDRTYLFSQERGVVNRVEDALSTPDQQQLYQRAEQKIATAAEDSQIANQAKENTRAMLVGMFSALDIKVTFV